MTDSHNTRAVSRRNFVGKVPAAISALALAATPSAGIASTCVSALPTTAIAVPEDAKLLRLAAEFERVNAEIHALHERRDVIYEEYLKRKPAPPEVLRCTTGDFQCGLPLPSAENRVYTGDDLYKLSICRPWNAAELPAKARFIDPKGQRRLDEILAVLETTRAEDDARRADLGLDVMDDHLGELDEAFSELIQKITATPARTLQGTLAKAHTMQTWYRDDPVDCQGADGQLAASIVRDLLVIGGSDAV